MRIDAQPIPAPTKTFDANEAISITSGDHGSIGCESSCDPVPEWFRGLSRRLFMAPGAPDGWAAIHTKPHVACSLLLSSRFVCVGLWAGIYLGGFSQTIWYRLVPLLLFVTAFHFNTIMFWRIGPAWAATRIHSICRVFAIVCLALITVPSFVSSQSLTPFDERSYFIISGSVALWLMVLGAQLGASKYNQFPEPLKSLHLPLINSIWNTIRILDPVTDMSLVRIALKQSDPPCYWLGSPCPCSRYNIMASVIGVFTFVYLLASIAITLGEKRLSERTLSAGITAQTLVFCVSFTCEALLVALTVLQLLTASRDPRLRGDAGSAKRADLRGDIVVTALSFALTCAAFSAVLLLQVRRVRAWLAAGGAAAAQRARRVPSAFARRTRAAHAGPAAGVVLPVLGGAPAHGLDGTIRVVGVGDGGHEQLAGRGVDADIQWTLDAVEGGGRAGARDDDGAASGTVGGDAGAHAAAVGVDIVDMEEDAGNVKSTWDHAADKSTQDEDQVAACALEAVDVAGDTQPGLE
eukprot:jgi/Ulvmu1/8183/UM040_0080.1